MSDKFTVITPQRRWRLSSIQDVWDFRELLWILITRDLLIRYKQTVIGIAWALVQPLMTMVVFTIIFGRIGNLPSDGLPYPIFIMVALLPWQLFAKALSQASLSMVSMGAMMGKIYFPRIIAPLSSVLSGVIDFAISFLILIALMAWYNIWPSWPVVFAPVFMLLGLAAAFSVSLWLSVINVKYRDVQQAMPFLTQIWLFVTPVIYPTSAIPDNWTWLYSINPMVSVIDGFRWSLLSAAPPDIVSISISCGSTFILLLSGLLYFGRFEKDFVDRL